MRDNGTGEGIKLLYDADGNRVAKIIGPSSTSNTFTGTTTATKYLTDTNNLTGYAQVSEELTEVNGLTVVTNQFTYGNDLISQRQLINGNRVTSFFGYDGHGSVRFLTDSNGNVTDTYDYSAYGELINQTGSTPNNYLYAGEQFDHDLGLYFNRSRYLSVEKGRFWTQDSYGGDNKDPLSLHKYLYTGNNPLNRWDPSGKFFIQALFVVAIVLALIAIFPGCGIRVNKSLTEPHQALYEEAYRILNNAGSFSNEAYYIDLSSKIEGGPNNDEYAVSDKSATVTKNSIGAVTLYNPFFDINDTDTTKGGSDAEQRAFVLMHEGIHLSQNKVGKTSEPYVYAESWKAKDKLLFTKQKYGGTKLWNHVLCNTIKLNSNYQNIVKKEDLDDDVQQLADPYKGQIDKCNMP